jgi:hypothetical protein
MWRLLGPAGLVLVLATVALAPAARTTTAPNVFFNIHVTLTNSRIIMDNRDAPRGTYARFIVRNTGTRPLNFTLGRRSAAPGRSRGSAGRSSRARSRS